MRESTRRLLWHALLILLLATMLFCVVSAHAQTANVPVSGNVKDLGGSASCTTGCKVRFTITNCGDNQPKVGGSLIGESAYKEFTPDPVTGAYSGSIFGDDQISCGGITDATRYYIGLYKNGRLVGFPEQRYHITGTTTFNPATATAENSTPPPSAGNDYAIRNGDNTFKGHQDFTAATVTGISVTGTAVRHFLPAETPNGSQLTFTFGATPNGAQNFQLFWNGVLLSDGDDYTLSGNVATMTRAPKTGDKIIAVF